MKKRTYHLIFALVSGLCLICILVMQALKMGGIHLWIGSMTTAKLVFCFSCVLSWLVFGWLIMIVCGKVSSKGGRCWACVALILLMLPVLGIQWISWRVNYSDECAVFLSPDKDHIIVVQEETGFFSHGHTVFELTSNITMRKIGAFSTEPHDPEEIKVQWLEDKVEISIGGYHCWCTFFED